MIFFKNPLCRFTSRTVIVVDHVIPSGLWCKIFLIQKETIFFLFFFFRTSLKTFKLKYKRTFACVVRSVLFSDLLVQADCDAFIVKDNKAEVSIAPPPFPSPLFFSLLFLSVHTDMKSIHS